jgi:hypothetical protein
MKESIVLSYKVFHFLIASTYPCGQEGYHFFSLMFYPTSCMLHCTFTLLMQSQNLVYKLP